MPLDAPLIAATRCGCWPSGFAASSAPLCLAGLGQQLFGRLEQRAVLRRVATPALPRLLRERVPQLGLLDGELDVLVRRRVAEDVHRILAALDLAQVLLELLSEQ